MCVIVASPNRFVRPSKNVLRRCEGYNPDGIGMAWLPNKSETVRFEKGIELEEAHRIMHNTRGPVIIHFRYATVGAPSPALCHPFLCTEGSALTLSGSVPALLFHNGTWTGWKSSLGVLMEAQGIDGLQGEMSDSRAAALMAHYYGEEFIEKLPGRYAYFDEQGFRLYGDGWYKREGNYFSNLNWLDENGRASSAEWSEPPERKPLRGILPPRKGLRPGQRVSIQEILGSYPYEQP